ncbi:nucleoside phosphorylase domain-containing protein [Hypoxylon argillaceum]|nr:nucleoside phosphorylase domain-containing protein [Hypoxylon argillaceum]
MCHLVTHALASRSATSEISLLSYTSQLRGHFEFPHLHLNPPPSPLIILLSKCRTQNIMADSTPSEVSSRDQNCLKYTIGWICVRVIQQTVAIMMLDESHADVDKHHNDPNTYNLGRMGQHNVVIACLPQNQGGSNTAATIAVWMTTTFPEIKLCLLVGLGSGIPHKVRLGDVVVGMPYDELPGVVEWHSDRKKTTAEMGHPPAILLSALTKIKTNHAIYGFKLPKYLTKIKENERLARIYLVSDVLRDPLCNEDRPGIATEVHTQLKRTELAQDYKSGQRDMEVHYGLIASTSRPIRDKDSRESLDSNLGNHHLLCVETEVSGLVTKFPCLVIRGICDYLCEYDGNHKGWQGPASAVAAAFAKEVISVLPVTEVACLPTIQSMGASVF